MLALAPSQLSAATVRSFLSSEGKIILSLRGEIQPGDFDLVASQIKGATRTISGIRLNSPGGNLVEGAKLLSLVQVARIATVVPNGAECASACFLIFAAGSEKFVSYAARVGVHGASDRGRETMASNAATVSMARLVKEVGVPPAIIGKMVVTPPSEMLWLTVDDLRSMGVTMTGRQDQVWRAPAQPAPLVHPEGPLALGNGGPPEQDKFQASPKLSWGEITDMAFERSRRQNGGKARTSRVCQPELKVCNIAIFYVDEDRNEAMFRLTEDVDGKPLRREHCTFNKFEDVRTCFDWDRGTTRKDMKDHKGNWSAVEAD